MFFHLIYCALINLRGLMEEKSTVYKILRETDEHYRQDDCFFILI